MASVILPDHGLIRHPTILRRPDPPLLVNGGLICDEGDLKCVVFYRMTGDARPACEVLTVAMAESDFDRSLLIAAIDHLPGILAAKRLVH